MRVIAAVAMLGLTSCWTAERVVEREPHGRYLAVEYAWDDLWGPCPKSHSERRLYGPDGGRLMGDVRGMSDSPDGRWTVGQSDQSGCWMFVIDHRSERILKLEGYDDSWFLHRCWSPVGSRILLQRSSDRNNAYGLVLLDLGQDPLKFTTVRTRPYGRSEESICWAPDGKSIAFFDRGPGSVTVQSFELVQIQVEPVPTEILRTPLEKVGDRWWDRYEIRWAEGRPQAVPKR